MKKRQKSVKLLSSKKIKNSELDFLKNEYENVIKQFVHWDALFWSKNQFFLGVESIFVIGSIKGFSDLIMAGNCIPRYLLVIGLLVTTLNIFICLVWYGTSVRNRAYVRIRIRRAQRIENIFRINLDNRLMKTFTWKLPKKLKHQSVAKWEIALPLSFLGYWLIFVVALFSYGYYH